jgi:hypothetical protein
MVPDTSIPKGTPVLEARPAKRDAANRFSRDVRYEIYEADAPIGALVYDIKSERATLTIRGRPFTAARERPRQDEAVYRAAMRKLSGAEKPPNDPMLLKDADGAVIAQGESKGTAGWLIARGEERFDMRRRSAFSRLYDLYREGQSRALGAIGPKAFFTTRFHVDLPDEFDALFQAFTIALHTDLTFVALSRMQN